MGTLPVASINQALTRTTNLPWRLMSLSLTVFSVDLQNASSTLPAYSSAYSCPRARHRARTGRWYCPVSRPRRWYSQSCLEELLSDTGMDSNLEQDGSEIRKNRLTVLGPQGPAVLVWQHLRSTTPFSGWGRHWCLDLGRLAERPWGWGLEDDPPQREVSSRKPQDTTWRDWSRCLKNRIPTSPTVSRRYQGLWRN